MFIPFIIPNVSDIGAGSQCYVGIYIPRVLAAWNDSSVKFRFREAFIKKNHFIIDIRQ